MRNPINLIRHPLTLRRIHALLRKRHVVIRDQKIAKGGQPRRNVALRSTYETQGDSFERILEFYVRDD